MHLQSVTPTVHYQYWTRRKDWQYYLATRSTSPDWDILVQTPEQKQTKSDTGWKPNSAPQMWNYQAYVWKALEPIHNLSPADQQDDDLQPVLMYKNSSTKAFAVEQEVFVDMPCTEGCAWLAKYVCENPRTSPGLVFDACADDYNEEE